MTQYEKGYKFELRVWEWLESKGWWVMRSAGSHGPADLAAFKPGRRVMLIACRTNRSRYSLKEQVALRNLAYHLGHKAYMAYREPKPPWTLHLEELSNPNWLIWKPDEEALPPWHGEKNG